MSPYNRDRDRKRKKEKRLKRKVQDDTDQTESWISQVISRVSVITNK